VLGCFNLFTASRFLSVWNFIAFGKVKTKVLQMKMRTSRTKCFRLNKIPKWHF
jgi:hypothetical protein